MAVLFKTRRCLVALDFKIHAFLLCHFFFLLFLEVKGAEHIHHKRTITLSGRKHLVTIIFWKSVRRSDQGAGKVAR